MQPPSVTQQFPPLPLHDLLKGVSSFATWALADKHLFIDRVVAAHPILSVNWGPGWRFRRARELQSGESLPENVEGLLWNPAVIPMQRANPEGFQILYVADNPETAFKEVRLEDSNVVLTEFFIRKGLAAEVAPIGEMYLIQRRGYGNLLQDKNAEVIRGILNSESGDNAKSLIIADAFLYHCLTEGNDEYRVSSHVVKKIFEKLPGISVVSYPSSQQLGGINFAIRGDRLWDHWGIVSVKTGHAKHLAFGVFNFDNHGHVRGIRNSGKLEWGERAEGVTKVLGPPWTPP